MNYLPKCYGQQQKTAKIEIPFCSKNTTHQVKRPGKTGAFLLGAFADQPQVPTAPQAVQKSQPSLRIIV